MAEEKTPESGEEQERRKDWAKQMDGEVPPDLPRMHPEAIQSYLKAVREGDNAAATTITTAYKKDNGLDNHYRPKNS